MSTPKSNDSMGDQGTPNGSDQDLSGQEAVSQADKEASLEGTSEAEASDRSSQPQYGDRNPNWTDRELPPPNRQQPDTTSDS